MSDEKTVMRRGFSIIEHSPSLPARRNGWSNEQGMKNQTDRQNLRISIKKGSWGSRGCLCTSITNRFVVPRLLYGHAASTYKWPNDCVPRNDIKRNAQHTHVHPISKHDTSPLD